METKKILIVEDDIQLSKVYELQLKKEGCLMIFAHDGEEATRLFFSEKPDLVILDLMLPKKDGFKVIEEIRKDTQFSQIPILVISNLGQKSDMDRALGAGATDYFVKINQSIQEITQKIKGYLVR